MNNLINNAIRYNKDNGSIQLADQYEPGKSYCLFIKDTGIGIHEEELPGIFNRFKKSLQAEGEGYGLGLSIVKSIVLFHGFQIKLSSELEKGTIVCITVPAEMVES